MAAKKKPKSKKPQKWMQKAFAKNKGALHKQMGVAQGEKIPMSELLEASKKGGLLGKRANAAKTGAKIAKRNAKRKAKGKRKK